MNDPNSQIEEILATLAATKEELKALEARLDRLESPSSGFQPLPGLSDAEREQAERWYAEDHAEIMEMAAAHRRERSKPGYAERKSERKRLLREAGFDV